MAAFFSDQQKSLAKTLMVATGSHERTLELLGTIWGSEADDSGDFMAPSRLPSPRALSYWKADPKIAIDEEFAAEWSQQARISALSTASRLADRMASAVEVALERYEGKTTPEGEVIEKPSGTALDVLNITKSFGILNDKQNGRYGNAPGVVAPGGQVFTGPVQILAYGPREPKPERKIEVDA